MHTPLIVQWGAPSLLCGVQPPWCFGFNEINRSIQWPQMGFGTLVFKKACTTMVCVSLGEVLHEISPISILFPNCLASWWSWISLTVLLEGALHVYSPLRSKCYACEGGMCWIRINMYCWGKFRALRKIYHMQHTACFYNRCHFTACSTLSSGLLTLSNVCYICQIQWKFETPVSSYVLVPPLTSCLHNSSRTMYRLPLCCLIQMLVGH